MQIFHWVRTAAAGLRVRGGLGDGSGEAIALASRPKRPETCVKPAKTRLKPASNPPKLARQAPVFRVFRAIFRFCSLTLLKKHQ